MQQTEQNSNFEDVFARQARFFKQRLTLSTVEERREKLRRLRRWVFENSDAIREAVYGDLKKPIPEIDLTEIKALLLELDNAIAHVKKWAKPKSVKRSLLFLSARGKIVPQPKGVCLIMSPWNFPFMLSLGPLVSAIAAGNCVFLKPSEFAPRTSGLIKKMAGELFPAEELFVVEGGIETSQALLKLPFSHTFFTGSTRVGKIIMSAAAQNLSSVTLELGGENPAIVDETAHLQSCARRLIWGRFLNSGQACVAPNMVFVQAQVREKLEKALKEELEGMFNKKRHDKDYGRLAHKKQFEHVAALIKDAQEKGAEVVCGPQYDEDALYIAPTILRCRDTNARLFREEIFGPLLALVEYRNMDKVIDFINGGQKPLALYIFSQNRKRINTIIKRTSSGGVMINDTTLQFAHPYLPFGGENSSGIGRSHGHHGFLAFSNRRSILKQGRWNTSALIYPPYTRMVKKIIRIIVRYL